MSVLPGVSEATIRQHASADSFSRGREYARDGAVSGLVRRGNQVQAEVIGSQYEPYRVRVTFDAGGVTGAACSCPYDRGGWCKHIVATLLTCLGQPEAIEARPGLDEALAGLDRDQLQALLLRLAERDPELAEAIEAQAATMTVAPAVASAPKAAAAPAGTRPPVDTSPLRREVRSILTPPRYGDDYGYAGAAADELRQILSQQVQPFIDGGDGRNALRLLEAIADEYVPNWFEIDDSDGELGAVADVLGGSLAEALLTADLTPDERETWSARIDSWQVEADDYGVGGGFALARAAADQGWDAPALRRVLRGEAGSQGLWPGARPAYADDLARLRLVVLERQGRTEEYLNLARAEGQGAAYAVMLARLGRVTEAVEAGRRVLGAAGEALTLAQALRERGELEPAVQIAEHGLTLAEPRAPLATWLTELAEGLGRRDLALGAAEAAFRSAPSLSGYLKARELAGASWSALQTTLLDHLRAIQVSWLAAEARVDVFLHEGLIDDAIAVVKDSYSYDLLERVMDAAIPHRPAWVIAEGRAQAERIMDAGKADRYHYAIEWLRRARDAYRAAGRAGEWQQYLAALKEQHGRKYKLMGLMKQL